jgi:protein-disulfide isomerase
MTRTLVLIGIVVVALVSGSPPGFAQTSEDVKALRRDIDALRDGLKVIQNDLQEIKGLLRARPTAAAPAPVQEAVVSVDGAPFKGHKTAKVTLVDFTDYQ